MCDVIETWHVLAPAAIMRNPSPPTIPHGSLPLNKVMSVCTYPEAKQDSTGTDDGIPMYILNQWAMGWGEHTGTQRKK